MVWWVIGSNPICVPIKLFVVPTSTPQPGVTKAIPVIIKIETLDSQLWNFESKGRNFRQGLKCEGISVTEGSPKRGNNVLCARYESNEKPIHATLRTITN